MNLYFRFFCLVLKRVFQGHKQNVLSECKTNFIVWPTDLDLNFHMNNGVFFSLMDLSRFDLMLKTKSFFRFFRTGYYPVVLSESMYFNKSLNLFEHFTITSKIRDWDENFFYFTTNFETKKGVVATATVRTCFKRRGQKGLIKTQEIMDFFGEHFETLPLSDIGKNQIALDESMFDRETKRPRS